MSDHLATIPLFAKLSDEDREALSVYLKPREVPANQTIFWIGEVGTELLIIESGQVRITVPDEMGQEITLAILSDGQFFGDISLLDGGPRTATARAQTDARLLSLGRDDLHRFLAKHPSAAIHMLSVIGSRHREMVSKLRGVKNLNEAIEERSTTWHRIADRIAAVSASQPFFVGHILFFTAWLALNTVLLSRGRSFDPFPFALLTLTVSLESILLSIFILISQNRESEKDRLRADLDYQVNLKAHVEVMQLHQKIDQLAATIAKSRAADRADDEVVT